MPFTPGPWEVSPKCGGTVIAQSPEGLHAETGHCDTEYYGGYLIAESVTACNLPLIAAAPDLLEALKTMVDKCEPLVGDLSSETSPHSFIPCMADVLLCIKQAVEDAEVAITQAEGK